MMKTTLEAESEELERLGKLFTDADYDQMERELRLRAAVLGWTGDPLRQPVGTVLAIARQIVAKKETRTVLIKVGYLTGAATLAHPDAKTGLLGCGVGAVKAIEGVPADVPASAVLQRWKEVVDATGLRATSQPRFVFQYSELTRGRIIFS